MQRPDPLFERDVLRITGWQRHHGRRIRIQHVGHDRKGRHGGKTWTYMFDIDDLDDAQFIGHWDDEAGANVPVLLGPDVQHGPVFLVLGAAGN